MAFNKTLVNVPTGLGRFQRPTIMALNVKEVMRLDLSTCPRLENVALGISLKADFEFTYAIALTEHKLVALFIDGWSGNLKFVGKLYDFKGNEIAVVPFPPNGSGGRQNAFWYASETSEGVRVNFHQQSERDFSGNFSLDKLEYLSFHEAR
jgi:hypothetical protein